jgi:origin recognition complex subunit 6
MASSTASTITRTLNLIIPTASTLPPTLINLATDLLAQSRAKAPSLKPDEEIARPFACCHIACERLKNRLALEIGKVGPPCGPRIYKKLYAFLDSTLVVEPSTPRTKRVQDVVGDAGTATPGSGRAAKVGGNAAAAATGSTTKATPGSLKRSRAAAQQVSNLPRFTMPLIRHVCEAQGTPRAATHVYAGVESVYRSLQTAQELEEASAPGTPSKRRKSNNGHVADEIVLAVLPVPTDEQVPALVAVVSLMTASSMRGKRAFAVDNGQKRTVQSAVEGYFAKNKTAAVVTLDSTELKRDIDTYMQAAKSWADMEWYLNIPAAGELPGDEDDGPATPRKQSAKTPLRRKEKHSQRKIGDEDVYGPAGLLPGLGTMFQPAVDWLSEDRREDFAAWKQDILSSVEAIEQKA